MPITTLIMNLSGKYLFAICLLAGVLSCKKENKPVEDESQGTNFNFLQKTILKSPDNSAEKINLYEYNLVGQVVKAISFDKTNGISSTIKNTETFYRSTSSRLDSVVFVTMDSTVLKYKAIVLFTYDFTNKISKSIQTATPGLSPGSQMVRDSSLYFYTSGQLSQRTDYRSHDNNPYSLVRDLYYNYDATGNLLMLRLVWPTVPTDTVKFTFDNKTNSIPVERGIHFWAPAFYDDYKFTNNPISKTVRSSDSYTYEYRYAANNKPLYRKEKVVGTPAYGELYYYYD